MVSEFDGLRWTSGEKAYSTATQYEQCVDCEDWTMQEARYV